MVAKFEPLKPCVTIFVLITLNMVAFVSVVDQNVALSASKFERGLAEGERLDLFVEFGHAIVHGSKIAPQPVQQAAEVIGQAIVCGP